MRLPFLVAAYLLMSFSTCHAFNLHHFIEEVEDQEEKVAHHIGHTAKKSAHIAQHITDDATDKVKDGAKKVLPNHVIQEVKKLKHALESINPEKLKHSVVSTLKSQQDKVLNSVVDPKLVNQIKLIIHDLQFLEKQGKALLEGPCGQELFTKEIPLWFKKQISNVKELFSIGATGTKIALSLVKHTPDFLKLAGTMAKINIKVAEHALDPENQEILANTADHIKNGIEKFKDLPQVIADTTILVKDVGILVTEGTTCVDTLVTDIEEGIEGVVEALGGVAACTTGAGCLEELLTVKSVAVGAVSTLASDASCALTVANVAKNGARDVINLINLLYSYTALIDAVISLKDDVSATYEALNSLSDDIKEDIPELEEHLYKVGQIVVEAEQEINNLIPRIRHFATSLLLQLKGTMNKLMFCKSEVGYILKLGAYTLKDGFDGSIKAAAHFLKAEQAAEAVKQEFSNLIENADHNINKRIAEIKRRAHKILHNPIVGVKQIPDLVKEIADLPIDFSKDMSLTATSSIQGSIDLIKHHQDQARKELGNKDDYGGIENVKKPNAPRIEGDFVDEGMEKAKELLKHINMKKKE